MIAAHVRESAASAVWNNGVMRCGLGKRVALGGGSVIGVGRHEWGNAACSVGGGLIVCKETLGLRKVGRVLVVAE